MTDLRLTILDLDTATARRLARCNALPQTAAISIRPDTRRPAWLARDLLAAVGIRHDVSGQTRRDADDRQLVPMWLSAHDVDDIIVVGMEALPSQLLTELFELAALSAANLWLIADHVLPDGALDVLAAWPVQPCPPDQFARRWLDHAPETDPTPADQPEDDGDGLPEVVPHVDFTLFRATARRQLGEEAFAAVDALFVTALTTALDAIAAGTTPEQTLRDAVSRCQSSAAVCIAARAVQAAAWRHGHHLRVDLEALLALDDHAPVAAAADPSTWQQLQAYRQPIRQTTCALALLDIPVATQRALTLADVDLDRTAVCIDGVWQPLPTHARPTLRALVTSRLAVGANDQEPLFARLDGGPVSARSLADAVNAVQRETGLRLTTGQIERDPVPTTRWARRRGVHTTTMEI